MAQFYPKLLWEAYIMFEVTEKATEKIKEAFRDQEKIPSIRVVFNGGG
jgi:hypothetical protein